MNCDPVPLRVVDLRVRAVNVPIPPMRTAGGAISSCPLVLIDLSTASDLVGHSYVFAYTTLCLGPLARLIRNLEGLLTDQEICPADLADRLGAVFRLAGASGLATMAVAGIETAFWDAQAKAAGLPLVALLGGSARKLPAYWNVGLCDRAEARRAAEQALGHGCRALKIKVGHADLSDDLAAVRAAREVGGGSLQLMVDYNQALSVPEAKRRLACLEDEALLWIEEPTFAEDVAGHAAIAREVRTPIQLGENWSSPRQMAASLAAGASDLAMLDVMKIGGVTAWLRAAALAHAHGLPVSSHIFPELSAHLLAVTPTAHWLEYLDLASAILASPLMLEGGYVKASDNPGIGIEWNEPAVAQFAYRDF